MEIKAEVLVRFAALGMFDSLLLFGFFGLFSLSHSPQWKILVYVAHVF